VSFGGAGGVGSPREPSPADERGLERASGAHAALPAEVVRGSSPLRTPGDRAAAGATPPPTSYLTTEPERRAYDLATRALAGGPGTARDGSEAPAAPRPDLAALVDALDALTPASYNRVLHALLASKERDPRAPSLLDKLIARATARHVAPETTRRFFRQLEQKLAGQPGRVLSESSIDSRARLGAGSRQLADLF
jgi:hypothetical protein